MAADAGDLQFRLKLADEASGNLQKFVANVTQSSKSVEEGTTSLSEAIEKIKGAASTIAGIWAGAEVSHEALESYGELQKSLLNIQQSVGFTSEELKRFASIEFEETLVSQGKATEAQLLSIANAATQVNASKDQIIPFTKAVIDLGLNAEGAGAHYATALGQILNITDGSIEATKKFTDEIAAVSTATGLSTTSLVGYTDAVARAAGGYNVTKEEALALGEAFRLIPGRIGSASGAIAAIFAAINHDTDGVREGLGQLTAETGKSVSELQELSRSHPTEVFIDILQHAKTLANSPLDQRNFLAQFGIEAGNANRVAGIFADHVGEIRNSLNAATNAPEGGAKKFGDQIDQLQNTAETHFKNTLHTLYTTFGEALSPAYVATLNTVSGALQGISAAFHELPEVVQQGGAQFLVFAGLMSALRAALPTVKFAAGEAFDAFTLGAFKAKEAEAALKVEEASGAITSAEAAEAVNILTATYERLAANARLAAVGVAEANLATGAISGTAGARAGGIAAEAENTLTRRAASAAGTQAVASELGIALSSAEQRSRTLAVERAKQAELTRQAEASFTGQAAVETALTGAVIASAIPRKAVPGAAAVEAEAPASATAAKTAAAGAAASAAESSSARAAAVGAVEAGALASVGTLVKGVVGGIANRLPQLIALQFAYYESGPIEEALGIEPILPQVKDAVAPLAKSFKQGVAPVDNTINKTLDTGVAFLDRQFPILGKIDDFLSRLNGPVLGTVALSAAQREAIEQGKPPTEYRAPDFGKESKEFAPPRSEGARDAEAAAKPARGDVASLTPEQQRQEAALAPIFELTKQTKEYERTLEAIAALPPNAIGALTPAQLAQAEENLTLKERALDPIKEQIRQQSLSLDLESRTTASAREEVEIRQALQAAQEKDGNFKFRPDQQAAVISQVQTKNYIEAQNALENLNHSLDEQLAKQAAVNRYAEAQLDIRQKIADFQREHNIAPDDPSLKAQEQRLTVTHDVADTKDLLGELAPQQAATIDYIAKLDRINELKQKGYYTDQQALALQQQLTIETEKARSPLEAIATSSSLQLNTLKLTGDYREADARTLTQINDLQQHGVAVTDDQARAITTLNRDLDDLQKQQTQGFNGFVNNVGSLQDNVLKAEGTIASGISGSISSALTGGGFSGLQSLGQTLTTQAVNYILADTLKSFGLAGGTPNTDKVQADINQLRTLGIQQATMTVAQATINIANLQDIISRVPPAPNPSAASPITTPLLEGKEAPPLDKQVGPAPLPQLPAFANPADLRIGSTSSTTAPAAASAATFGGFGPNAFNTETPFSKVERPAAIEPTSATVTTPLAPEGHSEGSTEAPAFSGPSTILPGLSAPVPATSIVNAFGQPPVAPAPTPTVNAFGTPAPSTAPPVNAFGSPPSSPAAASEGSTEEHARPAPTTAVTPAPTPTTVVVEHHEAPHSSASPSGTAQQPRLAGEPVIASSPASPSSAGSPFGAITALVGAAPASAPAAPSPVGTIGTGSAEAFGSGVTQPAPVAPPSSAGTFTLPPGDPTKLDLSGVPNTIEAREALVRAVALREGVNPNQAVAIAHNEGLNYTSRGPNQDSVVDVDPATGKAFSHGDFQLDYKHGLGVEAAKAGILPGQPDFSQRADAFAVDYIAKHGTGPFNSNNLPAGVTGAGKDFGLAGFEKSGQPARVAPVTGPITIPIRAPYTPSEFKKTIENERAGVFPPPVSPQEVQERVTKAQTTYNDAVNNPANHIDDAATVRTIQSTPEPTHFNLFPPAAAALPSSPPEGINFGGDLSGASSYARKGEPLADVKGFVFHHTGGSGGPESVISTLNQRGLGVQYVMGRDGKIYETLPEGTRGAHILPDERGLGLSNANTEGMEVIAKDDKDLTPAQIQSGVQFAEQYKATHPDVQFYGHGYLNPAEKQATEGASIVNAYRAAHPDLVSSTAAPTNFSVAQDNSRLAELSKYTAQAPASTDTASQAQGLFGGLFSGGGSGGSSVESVATSAASAAGFPLAGQATGLFDAVKSVFVPGTTTKPSTPTPPSAPVVIARDNLQPGTSITHINPIGREAYAPNQPAFAPAPPPAPVTAVVPVATAAAPPVSVKSEVSDVVAATPTIDRSAIPPAPSAPPVVIYTSSGQRSEADTAPRPTAAPAAPPPPSDELHARATSPFIASDLNKGVSPPVRDTSPNFDSVQYLQDAQRIQKSSPEFADHGVLTPDERAKLLEDTSAMSPRTFTPELSGKALGTSAFEPVLPPNTRLDSGDEFDLAHRIKPPESQVISELGAQGAEGAVGPIGASGRTFAESLGLPAGIPFGQNPAITLPAPLTLPSLTTQNPLSDVFKPLTADLSKQIPEITSSLGNLKGVFDTGAGGIGSSISSLVSSLSGSGSGGSGGLGGLGGLFSGLFSGGGGGASVGADAFAGSSGSVLFHTGGLVGEGNPRMTRLVDPEILKVATKHHMGRAPSPGAGSGLASNEFHSILEKGERVLTAHEDGRVGNTLRGLTNAGAGRGHVINMTNVYQTPNPSSFRASESQINGKQALAMQRAIDRNL